jgi:hypothetical protein
MIGICAALASIPGSSRQAAPCCQFIIGGCFKFVLEGTNKLPVPGAGKLANMPELGKGSLSGPKKDKKRDGRWIKK